VVGLYSVNGIPILNSGGTPLTLANIGGGGNITLGMRASFPSLRVNSSQAKALSNYLSSTLSNATALSVNLTVALKALAASSGCANCSVSVSWDGTLTTTASSALSPSRLPLAGISNDSQTSSLSSSALAAAIAVPIVFVAVLCVLWFRYRRGTGPGAGSGEISGKAAGWFPCKYTVLSCPKTPIFTWVTGNKKLVIAPPTGEKVVSEGGEKIKFSDNPMTGGTGRPLIERSGSSKFSAVSSPIQLDFNQPEARDNDSAGVGGAVISNPFVRASVSAMADNTSQKSEAPKNSVTTEVNLSQPLPKAPENSIIMVDSLPQPPPKAPENSITTVDSLSQPPPKAPENSVTFVDSLSQPHPKAPENSVTIVDSLSQPHPKAPENSVTT